MATIPATDPPSHLPAGVCRGLRRIDRRLRTVRAMRGVGTLLLWLVGGVLAGIAADLAFVLPGLARWFLWFLWVAAGITALLRSVIVPLSRLVPRLDLAAIVERAHPEFGERITGAIGLLESGPHAPHGSSALIATLANQAEARAEAVDPHRVICARSARRRLGLGIGAVVMFALPVLLGPDSLADVARRFLMPWENIERVGRYVVTVREGDRIVALGDDVTVTADVRPRYGSSPSTAKARLLWIDTRGTTRETPMISVAEGASGAEPSHTAWRTWRATLPRVAGTFTYRVICGPARSEEHRIRTVERPAETGLAVEVDPPPYSGRTAHNVSNPARIEAWQDSAITLTLTVTKPLAAAVLNWPPLDESITTAIDRLKPPDTNCVALTPLGEDGLTWTTTVAASTSGPFGFALLDRHGLRNQPGAQRRLIVVPDRPPTVELTTPEDVPAESRPDDVLPVALEAGDDIALDSLEIHYTIRRGESEEPSESGRVEAVIPGLGTARARGDARLDLESLGLRPGDRLSYRVRVADNRPPPRGPNVAWTPERALMIVAEAESILARRENARLQAIREEFEAIRARAGENRKATEQLRYAADAAAGNNGPFDEARRQELRDREAAAREVVDRLNLLARSMDEDPGFAPMARPTRQTANVEAEGGRAMLEAAQRFHEDPRARLDALKRADDRLGATLTRLDELSRQFDELTKRADDRRRLAVLAERQEVLAGQTDELVHEPGASLDRDRLDRIRAEQAELVREVNTIIQKDPVLRAEAMASRAQEAATLAEQVRSLAERQREGARNTADSSRYAKAIRAIADAQRALEDDARRLSLDVDDALAENERGRLNLNALAEPIQLLENGDFEGARQRLEGAEAELRRLASDLDSLDEDPRTLVRRLARRQQGLRDAIDRILRETVANRNDPQPDETAALAARLEPFKVSQGNIAGLVGPLPVPEAQRGDKEQAVHALEQARTSLDAARATEVVRDQDRARDTLNRLASALPDRNRQRNEARRPLDELRERSRRVEREIDRHLRETPQKPGFPTDAVQAAADLAGRLAGPARDQAEIAEQLRTLDLGPEAAQLDPQRDRAVLRARRLAEALAEPRRDDLGALVVDAREALERLNRKSRGQTPADDIADEIHADWQAIRAANGVDAGSDGRLELAGEMGRVATALRGLDLRDATTLRDDAARTVDRAVARLGDPNVGASLDLVDRAIEKLVARLSEVAPGEDETPARPEIPRDPEWTLGAAEVEQAIELARRERRIRERLQSLLMERIPEQEAIRNESVTLARQAETLRDRVREVSPRAQGTANEAAQLLGQQTPPVMDQSIEQLARGAPITARDIQRRATEILERAADRAEDLATSLRTETPPELQDHADKPSPLAGAQDAQQQAVRQLDEARRSDRTREPVGDAAEAMRRAAENLRLASQPPQTGKSEESAAGEPSMASGEAPPGESPPGEPGDESGEASGQDPQGAPAGVVDADLSALQELVRRETGRVWGELPGHLRSEILQLSRSGYREDYARLIRLYFREIAAGNGSRNVP